jgi:hypothetical protein
MTFLDHIAQELKQEFGPQVSDLYLIVPTRRAVQFLRDALADAYQQTLWSPRIVSIQDFVRETVGWQFPEVLPLVFELYQVYGPHMRRVDKTWYESFEQFYNWGEMLVKDFDEIDKYLVEAKQLFTNIKDLKEIDLIFSLPEESLEPIRRFWQTLRGHGEEPSQVQQRFLAIWQELYSMYDAYRKVLTAKHQGYDGMAYRHLVGELEAGRLQFSAPKLVFIGFNALSTAEERMMAHLLRTEQAIVYWDVDQAYFTPPRNKWGSGADIYADKSGHLTGEEPGKFIREYHAKWQQWESRVVLYDMGRSDKDIHVTGVPLQVGQAQYLGNLLEANPIKPDDYRRHVIVLADENLLFPVLYALPDAIKRLNITMGFPLRQTNIHDLLLIVMRLLRNLRVDPHGQVVFTHREVSGLVNNPYIKAGAPDLSEQVQQAINARNLLFLSQKDLEAFDLPPLLQHLFHPPGLVEAHQRLPHLRPLLDYCETIFHFLLEDAQGREATLETEYVFQFYTYFQQLRDILETYQPELTLRGFAHLFRDMMQRARIPFEGEPLIGVQLMGFLETRGLDFETIYVLGSNEGNLPDTSTGNSFIPYNLRVGFGLPTYEEKDAIYAYHFYRLLQRAKQVHLIYNTVVSESSGRNEVSRFIRQIRHFFRKHPTLHVHERLVSTPAPYVESQPISILQQAETQAVLRQRYLATPTQAKAASQRYFSATALTTYLGCRLRFYFRYVAGIKEPEQVEETMEANTFGSVLHLTLEYLYQPYIGRDTVLDREAVKALTEELPNCLRRAFEYHKLGWGQAVRGKNYLLRGVIQAQCEAILRQDAQGPAFQIMDLENDDQYVTVLDSSIGPVRVNGAFDRIDWLPQEQAHRILDYKTGKVEIVSKDALDKAFTDDKYKAIFQGYLYALLFARKHGPSRMQVGFYAVRHLSEGIQFLSDGQWISQTDLNEFEQRLQHLIEEVFTAPFTQTEDEAKCSYCPYNVICNRG